MQSMTVSCLLQQRGLIMKNKVKMKLFLLIIFFGNNILAQGDVKVVKDFEVYNHACFMHSLDAIDGAMNKIVSDAKNWCKSINGNIKGIGTNYLEVMIQDSWPTSGCPGDVTVKSTFTCLINTNAEID